MRGRTNRRNLPSAARNTGRRKLKQGYRSHKLKPYREAAKAEKAAFKANVNFQYHKALHDNPQLTSNPFPVSCRNSKSNASMQRRQRKAAQHRQSSRRKDGAENRRGNEKRLPLQGRHPAGVMIAVAALLLFIMVSAGLSSCGAMFSGA